MQKRTYIQPVNTITHLWHHEDATDQILGRMAQQIATWLIGKHKPTYTPNVDAGDFVVVTNASKIAVTGAKLDKKIYYRHSLTPGGLKQRTLKEMIATFPEEVIRLAVYNMLPKNKLRTPRMNRLKVYAGAEHPHQAQLGQATQE